MTRVAPIRFTRNVRAATDFYALLGLEERTQETSRTWANLTGSGGGLALHIVGESSAANGPQTIALHLVTDTVELEVLRARVEAGGFQPGPIVDETFGRFFVVRDPDGYLVQVDETPEDLARAYETEASIKALPAQGAPDPTDS